MKNGIWILVRKPGANWPLNIGAIRKLIAIRLERRRHPDVRIPESGLKEAEALTVKRALIKRYGRVVFERGALLRNRMIAGEKDAAHSFKG